MSKKERNIAIGVLLLLLIIYFYRKPRKKTDPLVDEMSGGGSGGSGGGGGGGAGSSADEVDLDSETDDNYTPTGTDDVDSQAQDPFSPVTTSKGDTPPFVGDVMSGLSGTPAVGTPITTTVKTGLRSSGRRANPSQQRLVRGYSPRGGGSYFK